jgi:hypothetical protein
MVMVPVHSLTLVRVRDIRGSFANILFATVWHLMIRMYAMVTEHVSHLIRVHVKQDFNNQTVRRGRAMGMQYSNILLTCCSVSNAVASVCSGSAHGQCTDYNTCTCNAGYSDAQCSTYKCFGTLYNANGVCSAPNGTCTAPDTCTCATVGGSSYYGSKCEMYNCGVYLYNSSLVCSTNGTCVAPGKCSCKTGFYGSNCETYNCYGVAFNNASVCTSGGSCVSPNSCSCYSGYSGNSCQTFYCSGVVNSSPNVCNQGGKCTKPDVCTCDSCHAGQYCDFSICQQGAISLQPTTTPQFAYYNVYSNVTIRTSLSIPTTMSARIYCTLTNQGNTVLVPTSPTATPTDYICLFPPQSGISASQIGLAYFYGGLQKNLSSNSIYFTFVRSGSIALRTDNYYDFGVAGILSWTMAVNATTQLQTSDNTPNVVCRHETDGVWLPTITLSDTSFACKFSEGSPRVVNLALYLVYNGNSILLSSNSIAIPFISNGTISYQSGQDGGIMGTTFTAGLNLQAWIPDIASPSLTSRMFCLINSNYTTGRYSASMTGATWPTSSTYSCALMYNTPGIQSLRFYLAPPSLSSLSPYLLSVNTLQVVIVEQVAFSDLAYPSPFISISAPTASINIPLKFVTAHAGYTIDNYYKFSNNVTYVCKFNGVTYAALWIPSNSTVSCTITSPTGNLKANVNVFVVTAGTSTAIQWTKDDATLNSLQFYTQYPATALNPYLIPYGSSSIVNSTIQVTLPAALPYCSVGLYMVYTDGSSTKYVTATCTSTVLTGSISVANLLASNTTVVPIGLVYGYRGVYVGITTSNVYLTYIRTPIDFVNAPSVFQPGSLSSYNLSFAIPDTRTQLSYNVSYIQDTSQVGSDKLVGNQTNLSCDFSSSLTYPKCTFASITPLYVPIKLNFMITFRRVGQAGDTGTTIAMNSHYYKQPINVVSNLPFFTDTQNTNSTPVIVTLTADVNLHPQFGFICKRTITSPISTTTTEVFGVIVNRNQFTCQIRSLAIDHNASISLWYNTVQSQEISGYSLSLTDVTTGIASGSNGTLEFNTLMVYPPIISGPDVSSSFQLVYRNTSVPYSVPSQYRSLTTLIKMDTASVIFIASLNSANGGISFLKNVVISKGLSITYDIQTVRFSVYMSTVLVSSLTPPAVIYQPKSFVSKFPRVVLRNDPVNPGSDTTVMFSFNPTSMFQISIPYSYQIYTQTNFSLPNKVVSPCSIVDQSTLACDVSYNSTQLVQNWYVSLFPYIRIPSFYSNEFLLSTNSFDDDIAKLFYMDYGNVTFTAGQQLFQFTQVPTTIQVQFDTTTSLPNILSILSQYFYCHFISQTGTYTVLATYISSFTSSGTYSYIFSCSTSFPLGFVGKTNIALLYEENETGGTSSYIAQNYVDFMTLTDSINLLTMVPMATRVNLTSSVTLQTSFLTVDYGSVQYYIRYLFVNGSDGYAYEPTAASSGGYFSFSLTSDDAGTLAVEVIMSAMGVNQTISNAPINFLFVDGNFLLPSWGTLAGNAVAIMNPFEGNDVDQNITFKGDTATYLPCKHWNSPTGHQLNCTTPHITKYAPFQSFILMLGNSQIPIRYVLIDTRIITVNVTVFPTGSTISVQVVMNNPVTFTTGEGSAVLQISSKTLTAAVRDDLGVFTNNRTISRTYSAMPAGSYDLTLMYQNVNLFETRSMVAFTNSVTVTFIDTTTVSYATGSSSALFVNSAANVSLSFVDQAGTQLATSIRRNVKCKVDSPFVTVVQSFDTSTAFSGNQVTCTLLSTQPVAANLSLWYVGSDAPNGGFQISKNTVVVLMMEKLNIAAATPWATLSQQQLITLSTTITSDIAKFAPYLTYSCIYYDPANPNPAGSFLNNPTVAAMRIPGTNQFNCTVSITALVSKRVQVLLYATVSLTNQFLSVSNNDVSLYFVKQVQLSYISPFVKSMVLSTDTVQITMTTSAPVDPYTDTVLTNYQLYCKYSTVDKQGWMYAPAALLSNTMVSCNITVTHSAQTELIDVRLWYNAAALPLNTATNSPFSFDLAVNNVTITFIKQPLSFITGSSISSFNGTIFRQNALNQYFTSNLFIPTQSLPVTYKVSMNAIEGGASSVLNCNFDPGSFVQCIIVTDSISVVRVPILFNFTVIITNTVSNEVVSLPITSLTYLENVNILRAYPYALSYSEYTASGANVHFTIDRTVNVLYNYQCLVVSQMNGMYSTIATLQNGNAYTCSVKSFNMQERVQVSLQFIQPQTLYGPSMVIPLSIANASLSFISPIRMSLPISAVPTDGTFTVKTIDPLPLPPTSYYNNTDYGITIAMNDRNRVTLLNNCTLHWHGSLIQCLIPSNINSFPSYPWYVKMDLYMMNGISRSTTLSPKFTFVKTPTFSAVLPSDMVLRVVAPVSDTYLTIQGANFFVSSYPITITYSCATCHNVATGNATQTGECTLISSSLLSCPSPQFDFNSGFTTGIMSVSFTMGGSTYQTSLKPYIYDVVLITISSVENTDCNPFTTQTVKVNGQNFVNGNIWVRFTDYSTYNVITQAGVQYVSSNMVTIQSPVLWNLNLLYPRSIWFSLSFDNGVNYIYSQAAILNYAKPPTITFYPTALLAGQSVSNLALTNFPSITTDANRKIVVELYDGTTSYPLTCDSLFQLCASVSSLPTTSSLLTFRAFSVNNSNSLDKERVYVPFTSSLVLYQFATATSVFPSRVFVSMTNALTLQGSFGSLIGVTSMDVAMRQSAIQIALKVDSITNSVMKLSGLSSVPLQPSSRRLQASDVDLIAIPPGSSSIEYLASSNPSKSVLLSVSFNWGADYASVQLSYLNQFRQPILTNLSPFISPRTPVTVLVQGKYLSSATNCVINAPAIGDYIAPEIKVTTGNTTSDYAVYCSIPSAIATNYFVSKVSIWVETVYNENSTVLPFMFHETINVIQVSPNSSYTAGGITTTVHLNGYISNYDIYVRFNELVVPKPCVIWEDNIDDQGVTSVNCTVPAHSNGMVRVMLSYDQTNWFMQGGAIYNSSLPSSADSYNYYYIACPAGYTAGDFSQPCAPCPAGTYKPTEGIYSCISCANGTFNPFEAQTNCSSCPQYTSSKSNSTDFFDCVCNPGFYYNPITPAKADLDTCLSCPSGSTCPGYNTSIPDALSGYWHAGAKPYTFYQCFPEIACPGGGVNNCSLGYTSSVCGLCEIGYYKWRNVCTECSANAWYKLLLALIALGVITVAFFAISSAKVSHLASISIAFSFWQIVAMFAQFDVQWPSVVSGSFTAASLANLNIDFLSPQCVFPEMTYTVKWVLITLLPFYFLAAFIALYVFGELRVLITNRTGKYIRIKYLAFREDVNDEEEEENAEKKAPVDTKTKFTRTILTIAKTLFYLFMNMFIWCRNFCVWFIKEGASRGQMRNFRNKIINSYTAFISFTYIFIMGQASQIMVCTQQADGTFTLNASPDITCYVSYGPWSTMLPLTVILYVLFGGGAILFFIALYVYSRYLNIKTSSICQALRERKLYVNLQAKEKGNEKDEKDEDDEEEEKDVELAKLEEEHNNIKRKTKDFNM